jgi:UDP-N-acetyl-D-glucosamine dehydrogenase
MSKVSVIGQGYVGLTLAIGAGKSGHEIFGIDVNTKLIDDLLIGKTDIPGIAKDEIDYLIENNVYQPTVDFGRVAESSIVIIAVPTPLNSNREPDLGYVKKASIAIANFVKPGTLIINESTSYPGTLRNFIKPLIEAESKLDLQYASAPERIDPGNIQWTLSNTPRILGGITNEATDRAFQFYSSFCASVNVVSSPEVAEAAKLFENTFRQINIALANEFSIISSALGFSTNEAIVAASTKPFGFMPFFPSIGVGGHCIPIDPSYLSHAANQVGVRANFIELANLTNLNMIEHVADKISVYLKKPLQNLKIQIIGIAYKSGVSDLRESPALNLILELRSRGAEVIWNDPLVGEWNGENSSPIETSIDLGILVNPFNLSDLKVWSQSGTRVIDLSANSFDYGWPKFL